MKEVTKRNFLSYLKKSVYVYYDNEENDTNFRNLKRSFKYKNHQHRVSRAGLKIKYEDNINETIIENLEDFIGKRSLNKKWNLLFKMYSIDKEMVPTGIAKKLYYIEFQQLSSKKIIKKVIKNYTYGVA